MKKNAVLFLFLLSLTVTFFTSCSDDSSTSAHTPFINLLFPNGGDSLGFGVSYTILWTDEIDENINIEIYQGQDTSDIKILSFPNVPSNGEYQFLVPFDIDPNKDYKVKLVSVLDSTIYDISETYFGFTSFVGDENNQPIDAVELTVPHHGNYAIYPTGDVDWYKVFLNSNQKYFFSNSSDADFDTEFYFYEANSEGTDIVELLLTDDDSGQGLQPYFEFLSLEAGYYFLRVAYFSNDPTKSKVTDTGYYTLNISENISLSSPNGGEVWQHESLQEITWDPDFTNNVILSLVNQYENVLNIATVSGSDGVYNWTVPSTISSGVNYKIRITNEDNSDSMDESDDYFAIADTISVLVPGTWNIQGAWSKWDGVWIFSDNGTWTNSWGTSGTWELIGDIIKWHYESGIYYIGLVEGDTMSGIVNGGSGLYGTWEAQRQIVR
ncbi:MAG: Ser-Thr-rich GPI-anchored membrane family protein [Candidatus Delongbacteria bacterium]